MAKRERKHTFDEIPMLYDEARPGYPEPVFDAVCDYAGLGSAARILEIGAGTGIATRYFASRGFEHTAVELGSNLCRFMAEKFASFPNVKIDNCSFEDWHGKAGFDLFLCAQAFHFIEPVSGLEKAFQVLVSGGSLALVWTVDYSEKSEFYQKATQIHARYLPESGGKPDTQKFVEDYGSALRDCGLFIDLKREEHPWRQDYTTESYLKLRSTFSPDLMLSPEVRARFHGELAALIESLGGTVTRNYRTVALLGRRPD